MHRIKIPKLSWRHEIARNKHLWITPVLTRAIDKKEEVQFFTIMTPIYWWKNWAHQLGRRERKIIASIATVSTQQSSNGWDASRTIESQPQCQKNLIEKSCFQEWTLATWEAVKLTSNFVWLLVSQGHVLSVQLPHIAISNFSFLSLKKYFWGAVRVNSRRVEALPVVLPAARAESWLHASATSWSAKKTNKYMYTAHCLYKSEWSWSSSLITT